VNGPAGEKGAAARRRPRTGREAYFLYVERSVEGGNEADAPLSAAGQRARVNFWKVWQLSGARPRLTAKVQVTSLT
jgi:hypothetical protein